MKRINVTQSFLPPIEEYVEKLKSIWESNWLTNQGPLLKELEKKIEDELELKNFHFLTNGTLALQLALRALNITDGEVITTPFTYVATTSAILWEGCTPVYVDIDPKTLCIDPRKIEAAITDKTKAIMAVHVFGNPCDVEAIDEIAKRHNLKVIYDAAHAFGAQYKGKSLFCYGDISTGSFHATKLFHTIEGGCVVVNNDDELSRQVELIKHFGQDGDDHLMLGMNAKASEFQAAMGLCNLKYVDKIIAMRKIVCDKYDADLAEYFEKPTNNKQTTRNYAYYPIMFKNEESLINCVKKLNQQNIYPRRYFYPSLNNLPYVENVACPVSDNVATRILCLPLYAGLSTDEVNKIVSIVNES